MTGMDRQGRAEVGDVGASHPLLLPKPSVAGTSLLCDHSLPVIDYRLSVILGHLVACR